MKISSIAQSVNWTAPAQWRAWVHEFVWYIQSAALFIQRDIFDSEKKLEQILEVLDRLKF